MISKTVAKLRDPEYRKAFVSSQINIGIPFQIRALLKSRCWTQENLAERTGMLQPRISALLTPGKVRPNIETLRRIAAAFDCGLEVRFVPFSELVNWSERFDPEHFSVPSFDEEIKQIEEREEAARAAQSGPTESTFVTISNIDFPLPGVRVGFPLKGRFDQNFFRAINVPSHGALFYEEAPRIVSEEFRASLLPPVTTSEQLAA